MQVCTFHLGVPKDLQSAMHQTHTLNVFAFSSFRCLSRAWLPWMWSPGELSGSSSAFLNAGLWRQPGQVTPCHTRGWE